MEDRKQTAGRTETEGNAAQPLLQEVLSSPVLTLNVKEVSALGGWSERTTTRLCQTGKLKAVRVMGMWRINKAAFLDFVGGR